MPSLHALGDGIWTLDGDPISFLTFPYAIRATIIDVGRGGLLVHSPVQVGAAALLESIPGQVRYLVSPNKLHHKFLADWQAEFPEAKLFAPPGLTAKRPDLKFDGELAAQPEPAWAGVMRQKIIRGSWFMSEVAFFHMPSATLILGDLIENHDPRTFGPVHRAIASAVGMLAPNGSTARNYRWTFPSRRQTREDLEEILSWEPERVVMAHGPIVEAGAQAFLQRAFGWAL